MKIKGVKVVCITLIMVMMISNAKLVDAELRDERFQNTLEEIDQYVLREMKAGKIPGLSLGIVYGNEIIYLKGYGYSNSKKDAVTEDTPFFIGSIGKTFTALAVRQLINEGKVMLTAPIDHYIPWFTLKDASGHKITIEDLLNHTSGLSTTAGNEPYTYNKGYTIEKLVRKINDRAKITKTVGQTWEYSNLNYIILGLLIEYVTGSSYEDYINQNIFEPMDMKRSFMSEKEALKYGLAEGYRSFYGITIPVHFDYPIGQVPAGYHISTAKDMSQYVISYLNQGYVSGKSVLPNNPIAAPENPLELFDKKALHYNEVWGLSEGLEGFYGHVGATPNCNSVLLVSQVAHYGVVVLTNNNNNYIRPEITALSIGNGITDILVGKGNPKPNKMEINFTIWLVPIATLVLCVGAILSCWKRKKKKIIKTVTLHIIPPIAIIVLIPIIIDNNWKFLIATNLELAYPIFLILGTLLITGFIKIYQALKNSNIKTSSGDYSSEMGK